ncbi:uncharacterized protein PHACADRAFT_94045, partial [Phanerochaete carnosa HHB-10118-sp]
SLEIEHFLGVADDVKKAAARSLVLQMYDPKDPYKIIKSSNILEQVEPTPAFPETVPATLGQWKHQAILRKAIEALGCSVELGTAFVSFQQDGEKVVTQLSKSADGKTVTEEAEFAYVVGADGGHSTVRKSLGVKFVGETREEGVMFVVDCVVEGINGNSDLHAWGDTTSAFAAVRHTGTGQVFQVILSGPDVDYATLKNERSLEALQKALNKVTGRNDLVKEIINWQGEWRANIRMAEKFQVDRVFLVGDAAHTHSPTGGQGMNSSIQDAFNLGWKLALVVKGHAPPALLPSYEIERIPVISAMLEITTDLFNRTFGQIWFRGRKLYQLDVNYRWSTIVLDERFAGGESTRVAYGEPGQDVRAGDRAPDAPVSVGGTDTRLFDIFSPAHHTVLLFGVSEKEAEMLGVARTLPSDLVKILLVSSPGEVHVAANDVSSIVVEDKDGHGRRGYGLEGQADSVAVVVRPDGMIGAFATSAKGLERYFSLVFTHA